MQMQRPERKPQKIPAGANPVIVCGLGRFGLRIVEHLREREIPVVVITDRSTREDRMVRAREAGAVVVEGDYRYNEVRAGAGIDRARALILAASSDAANLETALDVRSEVPRIRIVMRLDADKVAGRLCADFDIDAALSPPVLAASAFSEAALQPPPPPGSIRRVRRSLRPRPLSAPMRDRRYSLPLILLACLMCLFVGGVIVFRTALNLSWVNAIYFTATIVTTVGFGDYHLKDESSNVKMFGTLLMFSGVTLIAVISSLLTNFFVSGAATQYRAERIASRFRNHIILCGLGSVGFEIAADLTQRKIKFVIIDATPDDLLARNLSSRVPLLVGDATDPLMLRRAGIDRARAVVSAVSNDTVNLEIGFMAQSMVEEYRPNRPLRIVLRCFGADLARRIHARSNAYTLLSSAEIAAPLFVEAALADSGEQVPA